MELEIYEAFQAAGIPNDKAKSAVEAINKAIDARYSIHARELATRGDVEKMRADMAEMEARIIKWNVGSMFAAIGIFATLIKIMG
ncbi:MAG: hypothetical protein LBD68_10615 [Zoogloeaceae bacterium]|jgi:hypothetical protein|nr:hypothetical protein [Zoogloeaceae bacterium]